ncbi:MAG: hypothetical protein IKK93_11965 [Campylobacter sp.]|nr:hypothetical protein [Campylobacter sp.]
MADMIALEIYRDLESKKNNEIAKLEQKLKVETELSKRFSFACREYEQLTKEQDEHLVKLEQENTNQKDQLTKAIELIDKLLKTPQTIFKEDEDGEAYPFYNPEFANIQKQAKRFLKELKGND